jgi:serine/threonine protein kinase
VFDCSADSIGKGGVGEVFIGTKYSSGEKVAIKKLQTFFKGKDRLPMILNEISVMANSTHPNIVNYIASYGVGEELWVRIALPQVSLLLLKATFQIG